MSSWDTNVFINCPFDKEYTKLLKPLLFTIIYCGLNPRIALERADAGELRLAKIAEIISECRYSIHDLSRIQAQNAGDYFRLNMPFELGVDWGYRQYKDKTKKFLILESTAFNAKKAISDLAGVDFEAHGDIPEELVVIVRNWLAANTKGKLPSGSVIWDDYNQFSAELYKMKGFSKRDVDRLPTAEIIRHMQKWYRGENLN